MSLLESIKGAITRKVDSAKAAYLKALKAGGGDAILAAAEKAGVSADQVAADAGVLERAAELAATAGKLPSAERSAKDGQAKLDAVNAEIDAATKALHKLELSRQQIWHDAGTANGVVKSIRTAINELAALYISHADLLHSADAPPAVQSLWNAEEKQKAADAAAAAHQRKLHDAQKHVEKCESDLHYILWGNWPFPRDGMGMFEMSKMDAMRNEKDRYVAEARQQVAEAKEALQAIEATAP